jgi:hypothetical protein
LATSEDFSDLSLVVDPMAPPTVLSVASVASVGDLLFHSYGPVVDMSDGSQVDSGPLGNTLEFDAYLVAPTADGSRVYYQGWAEDDRLTFGGESLLVANAATFEWMDVDGNDENGITGIDLPEGGGWDGGGSYSIRAMALTPDGTKAYIAAGGEGALVADLVASSEPSSRLTPAQGGNDGDVTVVVSGSWPEGTTIALTEGPGPDVDGTDVAVLPNGALEARFDLRDQPTGTYDVELSRPGEAAEVLENAFGVEEALEDATVDFFGDFNFLATGEARIEVIVENTGNVDLTDLMVTLGFAENTRYKVELPAAIAGGDSQIDEEYSTADELGIEPIWLSRLPPQRSYRFAVTLAGPTDSPPRDWDVSISATVGYLAADEDSEGATPASDTATIGNRPQAVRAALGIGDLCSALDALSTAMSNAAKKAGNEMSAAQAREAMNGALRDAAAQFAVAKVKDLLVKGIAIAAASALLPGVGPMLAAGMAADALTSFKSCFDFLSKQSSLGALFSFDPNDKLTSTGLQGYIEGTETLRYRVRFENEADASAAAEVVTIRDELDENLDLKTLRVVGSSHDAVLSFAVDEATRTAQFVFDGIDLPPNAEPPEGEGWVEFEVRPAANLQDGATIRNRAQIVFDLNDPIETPVVEHTVDRQAPTTDLESLPETSSGSNVELAWQAEDTGVGVWDYTVYVASGDDEFEPWLERTSETSATYTGQPSRRYRFLVVGRDRLGNQEGLDEDTAVDTMIAAAGDDDGCGCRLPRYRGTGGSTALGCVALLLLARRRRLLRPAWGFSGNAASTRSR